ncbi:hypothetical protein HDU79_002375, partial [Rhizoclosmatium sp. JEL0117]
MTSEGTPQGTVKVHRPPCSISILLLVVIQTLVVALVVLLVPLLLSVRNTRDSNQLCVDTGRSISESLVQKIQFDANQLAVSAVNSWLTYIEDTITNFNLAVQNNVVDPFSIDSVYGYFRLIEQRPQKIDAIYIGMSDSRFLVVRGDTPNRVGLLYNGNTFPNCTLCTLLFPPTTTNPTLLLRQTTKNILVRFKQLDFRRWDAVDTSAPMDYFPFDFTTRIWYTQARRFEKPGAGGAVVQWTVPHFIINSNYTGVTADLAIWAADGTFAGVVAIDFTYMNLAAYVSAYKPTPNSFMFIMSASGLMTVSSFNETLGNATANTLKHLSNCTTPILAQISTYLSKLLQPGQDYASLGPSASYQIGNLYVQLATTGRTPPMVIVNGALKQDYQGDYDTVIDHLNSTLASNLTAIIVIGVALFVVTVLGGVVFTYFQITRPMIRLATYLELATQFQFKAIKDKGGY